ncbi:hypothetical protein LguiB_004171 [Lonicera macranthoides]
MMDAIFWKERGEDEAAATAVAKIQFFYLKDITLCILPKLAHFCKSFEEVELPQLESAYLYLLPKLDGLVSKGYLFSTKQLQNLRVLSVYYSQSVEVVFDLQRSNVNEGGHELAELSNQLQRVELRSLDNLRHVWKKGPHVIQGSSFQNLSYLDVENCGSLRHIFTPSIAKVLVGLQKVNISACENLEAIVAKEDEEEEGGRMMLFPQLTTLSLNYLPKLLNMTPKPYTINWSSLEKLTLGNCGKLIETMNHTLQVTSNNMETQQVRELHNLTVSFPASVLLQLEHLEELAICSCSSLEVVFDLQGLNVIQPARAFQYMSQLTVEGCDGLRLVFTPPIAKLLSRLQTLEIHDCKNLEAIVEKVEEEIILFPQLTSLSLQRLPKLLNIALQGSFKNLSSLHVEHCDSLKHVFTPSTAKFLLGLEEVKIVDCGNLEAIVAEEDKEEEKEGRLELEGAGGMTVMLFPKLNSLFLGGLRNLLTITPKPYTFNRSSLKVIDCDKLLDIQ